MRKESHNKRSSALSKNQMNTAKAVATYLSENISEEISLEDIAKSFYISQSHLQNAFKGVYGMTVSSYRREMLMREAAKSLAGTDLSISEIAGTFGYENASKFSAAFKRVMGETPSAYRKRY